MSVNSSIEINQFNVIFLTVVAGGAPSSVIKYLFLLNLIFFFLRECSIHVQCSVTLSLIFLSRPLKPSRTPLVNHSILGSLSNYDNDHNDD